MMFVYHYVIIPFHPQYLPDMPLREEGAKEEGASGPKPLSLHYYGNFTVFSPFNDLICSSRFLHNDISLYYPL